MTNATYVIVTIISIIVAIAINILQVIAGIAIYEKIKSKKEENRIIKEYTERTHNRGES